MFDTGVGESSTEFSGPIWGRISNFADKEVKRGMMLRVQLKEMTQIQRSIRARKGKYKPVQENKMLPNFKPAKFLIIRRYVIVFTNTIGEAETRIFWICCKRFSRCWLRAGMYTSA